MKTLNLLVMATAFGVVAAALPVVAGRAFAKASPSWQEPQKPAKPDKQLPDPNAQPPNPAQQNGQKPDQQQGEQGQQPPQAGAPQQSQSFSGKIVSENGQFMLKDAGMKASYKLDDQEKAKQFNGKQVMVTGTLDTASNTIHVTDIQFV